MNHRSKRRRMLVWSLLVVWLATLFAGQETGPNSLAAFNARTKNLTNTWAMSSLGAPSGLTASPVGHDVQLSWSPGTNGSGYAVSGIENGTSSTCGSGAYSAINTTVSTGYLDNGRFTPQGTWFCYRVQTSYGSWTSVQSNPTAAAQLGVVVSSVQLINGGTAGELDSGDQIVIIFNQPMDPSTGPASSDTVCASLIPSAILIASTSVLSVLCTTLESTNVGTLNGGTVDQNARWNATYAWNNGNRTLTVTLGARIFGLFGDPNATGTWTLSPTTNGTKLASATGAFHVCDNNTGGGNCLRVASGTP
jgi:hypothetical protein